MFKDLNKALSQYTQPQNDQELDALLSKVFLEQQALLPSNVYCEDDIWSLFIELWQQDAINAVEPNPYVAATLLEHAVADELAEQRTWLTQLATM